MSSSIPIEDVASDPRYSLPTNKLGLSARAQHALDNANIEFVGELIEWDPARLVLELDNFGSKSLRDVMEALDSIGLELSTTIQNKPNNPDEFLNILRVNRGLAIAEFRNTSFQNMPPEGNRKFDTAAAHQATNNDAARLPVENTIETEDGLKFISPLTSSPRRIDVLFADLADALERTAKEYSAANQYGCVVVGTPEHALIEAFAEVSTIRSRVKASFLEASRALNSHARDEAWRASQTSKRPQATEQKTPPDEAKPA